MRNKRMFKTFSVLCATLVLMGGFSVTAFAQGTDQPPAEDATNDSNVVVEETEDSPALTPEGNAALVDDFGGNKQLITVTTKAGNYFYILIDRANEDKETAVHFLNQVDEADLMALMEDEQTTQEQPATCACTEKCAVGAINTACPVCSVDMSSCTGKEPEPEVPEETPEPEEPAGMLLLEKLDADTKDVLAGARFEIKNTQTGARFQMETGEDGTAVSPLLPAGKRGEDGTWVLYEYEVREVKPPDGYEGTDQVWSFQFEGEETESGQLFHKLTIENERTELLVSKTDGETGEPVEGARLAVYPMAGEKEAVIAGETEAMMDGVTEAAVNGAPAAVWTSGTEPYLISGKLIAGGSYLLYEQEPPTGYAKAFPVRLQLSEDGTFVRELETAGAAAPLELEMLPQGSFRITASPVKEIQYFIERDGYPIPKEAIADGDLLTIRLETVFQNGDKAPAVSWTFGLLSSETAMAELDVWILRI